MSVDLQYVNAALTRAAFETVSQLPGTTAEGKVAQENYEKLVVAELTSYPWNFASTKRNLNLLSQTPDLPWLYAYQKPTDLLLLRRLEVEGYGIDYEVLTDKIHCDYGSDSTVIAKFTWRVPETLWPGWFGLYITRRMEAIFLRSPAGQYEEAASVDEACEVLLSKARTEDAKLKTPVDPRRHPLLDARRGAAPPSRHSWR